MKAPKKTAESTERVIFFRVPDDLAERVEDVRYWARIPSLVAFGIEALTRECERLEREQNKGKRWEARPATTRGR
jgi:hypothetical protein